MMKKNDSNFSVNYKDICNVEFIEIATEPDIMENFKLCTLLTTSTI
jgi:hypothetical protein